MKMNVVEVWEAGELDNVGAVVGKVEIEKRKKQCRKWNL